MGPSVNTYEKTVELIQAGMNVARLNFSHGTHQEHKTRIDNLKRAREELKVPLAIMLDTKGPEIRVGKLDKDFPVEVGQRILLGKELPITPGVALDVLQKGDLVLFDDGYISTCVVERHKEYAVVEVLNAGVIKSQKGVNIPNVDVPLPAMTERDIEDIKFGCQQDVDIIAASFIRSAEHVRSIKALLEKENKGDILLFAKIENRQGVCNFDSIVQVADGIMVARGDLGVELPIQEVPLLQKMMIRKCLLFSKPCITATQMLESMIHNPRPTRAEVSDVANAILDSTSAVMLSGETASGKYPIEAVKMMAKVIETTEKGFPYREFFYATSQTESYDISTSISLACVKTAYSSGASAIFAFTSSGSTARLISRFRPEMPIFALSSHLKTYHQMAVNWGVIPIDPAHTANVQEAQRIATHFARERNLIQFGDLVVISSGSPFGVKGTTNTMIVETIGEILVRGALSEGEPVEGEIAIILDHEKSCKGKIVVLSAWDERYIPILKHAKGIILQNHPEDLESENRAKEVAKSLNLPILTRVDEALKRLTDGLRVVLNPQKGAVYET